MSVVPAWTPLKRLKWRAGAGKTRPFSAGSGLVRGQKCFWAVGDDLSHLIRIPDGPGLCKGYRMFPENLPEDHDKRKKLKRDLEALLDLGDGRLIAFPSGSKKHRARGALIKLDKNGAFSSVKVVDFRPLIELLEKRIPDLNIEGGYVKGQRIVLLQRGNGKAGYNGTARMSLKGFLRGVRGDWSASRLRLKIRPRPLGRWGRVALGFTDGFWHDGAAYFAAAAEAGQDTYKDGDILGSVVGVLQKGRRPRVLAKLPRQKLEGLALRREKNGLLELCAVTDNDAPGHPATLWRVWLPKPRT